MDPVDPGARHARAGFVTAQDHADGVRELLMCDPSGRNALDARMRGELRRAVEEALADPGVRAIVIGSGAKYFSVGGDVGGIAELAAGQESHARMTGVGDVVRLLGNSCKPIVAAVNGHCVGAGAGLALLCDTIILGRSATMGFPFLKIGLVPDFGISYTLALRIGHAAARRSLVHARNFKAEEALHAGLADEVVEDANVRAASIESATRLARMPAHALRLVREMFRHGSRDLDACVQDEALRQALCFGSPDVREGIAAFTEKRLPNFLPAVTTAGPQK